MNIFKRIFGKFKKKDDTYVFTEELPPMEIESDGSKHTVTGSRNIILGSDAKIVPVGICTHPNKRTVNPQYLDGLPISEHNWTHCVFYKHDDTTNDYRCYFGGTCEYCKRVFIKGSAADPRIDHLDGTGNND